MCTEVVRFSQNYKHVEPCAKCSHGAFRTKFPDCAPTCAEAKEKVEVNNCVKRKRVACGMFPGAYEIYDYFCTLQDNCDVTKRAPLAATCLHELGGSQAILGPHIGPDCFCVFSGSSMQLLSLCLW